MSGIPSTTQDHSVFKPIPSCFYAVKPRVVYKTRVTLQSAKIASVPNTQKGYVVYESLFRCEALYVGALHRAQQKE